MKRTGKLVVPLSGSTNENPLKPNKILEDVVYRKKNDNTKKRTITKFNEILKFKI